MAIGWNSTGGSLPFGPKPTAPAINWGSPLTWGLVFDTNYAAQSASKGLDLVSQTRGTYTGTSFGAGPLGFHRTFLANTDKDTYATLPPVNGLGRVTVEMVFKGNVDTFGVLFSKGSGVSGADGEAFIDIAWDDTSHSITTGFGRNTTSGSWHDTNAVFGTAQFHHLVVSYDDSSTSNVPSVYKNGTPQPITQGQAPTGTRIVDDTQLLVGNFPGQSFGVQADIEYVRVWNRVLSNQEVRLLANNPWQIYRWSPPQGGANTVASSHAATGVLTGSGSTIAATATHKAKHTATGALTGPGSSIAGTARRFRAHPSSGAITGPGSSIAGTARRFRKHTASGVISGAGAAIVGSALRHGTATVHAASGALVGQGALLAGIAARFGWTVNAGPSTVWTGNAAATTSWAPNSGPTTTWTANPAASGSWTAVPGTTTTWTTK